MNWNRARAAIRAFSADLGKIAGDARGLSKLSRALGDPSTYALALLRGGVALRALTGRSFGTTFALRVVFHIDVFSESIGGGLRLPHPFGIVIGDGARVGEGCTFMHNTTIQRGGAVVGDGVVLGTGSVVLEHARVGDGAFIGALSVVRGAIPASSVAVGAPARVVREVS